MQDIFNGYCDIGKLDIKETNLGNYVVGKTKMPNRCRMMGNSVIGSNCKLGEYIMLRNCIVFDGAEIKSGSEYVNTIILPKRTEQKTAQKQKEEKLVTV